MTLIFFFRFLDASAIIAFKDLSRYFYPLRFLMVEQVKAGHLPLWNPYIFCGFPLLATMQICFFYPLTVIYYLLPFNFAFNYYIILHYFLAAGFMYALLRHFKLCRSASFFGGMVFAFSGYLLSVSNMNTSLSSVIWLPLAVLFWDKLVSPHPDRHYSWPPLPEGEGMGTLIILAILLALMFLGGEPTIIYVSFWFLFFYALVYAKKKILSLVLLFLAVALAMGLVAVQLFPLIELSRLSDRVLITSFDMISFRSFPPRELLTFIFPYFFGNPALMGGYTETLIGKTYQDWLISPYLGLIPLILIFFSWRQKRTIFFSLAALAALFLAFGKYTPLYRFAFQLIPGISLIRYPVKYLFLTTFCLAVVSAFGFNELTRSLSDSRVRFRKALFYIIPVFALTLLLSLAGYFFSGQIFAFLAHKYSAAIPKIFFAILSEIVKFNLQSFFNLAANLFILGLLFWAAYRERIKRSVFIGGIIFLTAADLLANGTTIAVGAAADVFSKTPENYSIILKDKELNRFFYTSGVEKGNLMISGDNYSTALFNAKDNFAANWHIPYQLYDFSGYESIRPQKILWLMEKKFKDGLFTKNFKELSSYNVKYLVSKEKISLPQLKLLRHKYQYGSHVYLYENREVKPRAYFVEGKGRVEINDYRPGKIVMKATAEGDAVLFLSEAYYPGWKFMVDGKEKKVLRQNAIFSAVRLNAGTHDVTYVYDPMSFKAGAVISIVCILFLGYCYSVKNHR